MSRLRMSQGISINTWVREWQPLKEASDRGDLELVKEYASKFEPTDQPMEIALAIAARGNYLDIVRYLLERGTSVGPDALRLARTKEVFEAFMELGGWKINDRYKWYGGTIIVPIIELDDVELLRWFIEKGADPNISDALYEEHPTAYCLPTAAQYASPPVVDLLLAHGAKLTPWTLHAAIHTHGRDPRKKVEMLHHLVYNCGCDINGIGPFISKYPPKEGTPLHTAAHVGCFDCIRWLIENGADVLKPGTGGLLPSAVCSTESGVLRLVSSVEECERNYREAKDRERTDK